MLGVGFLPTTASTAATYILPLSVIGLGMGLAFAPATIEGLRVIPPDQAGVASGTLNTARQLGGSLGAAVIGTLVDGKHGDAFVTVSRPALALVAALIILAAALASRMRGPDAPRAPRTPANPPPAGAAAP